MKNNFSLKKVTIVGDGVEIYSEALFVGFKELGFETSHFIWTDIFDKNNISDNYIHKLNCKIQNKFLIGPIINKINKEIIKHCKEFNPELIFIYRGQYIYPSTLKKIKKLDCKIFGYHNDDPFKKRIPIFNPDRYYLRSLKYLDWVLSYRFKNIKDYEKIGVKNTSLLRSYYLKSKNFNISDLSNKKYVCDVIFIGHWEDDGRDLYILDLVKLGVNVKLYGTLWECSRYKNKFNEVFGLIKPLRGDDYNLAINSAKIALVFLSKFNEDTYTRRCFEIPATKTLMISEYTDDLASLFKENEEIVFFRNKKEFVEKIIYYLDNEEERDRVSRGGFERLITDGHEVINRVQEILTVYQNLNGK